MYRIENECSEKGETFFFFFFFSPDLKKENPISRQHPGDAVNIGTAYTHRWRVENRIAFQRVIVFFFLSSFPVLFYGEEI